MNADERFPFEEPIPVESKPAPSAETKEESRTIKKNDIALTPEGLVAPTTVTEGWRIAEALLKSKSIPKAFQTVEQVFMGMQFLRQLNFPDIVGLGRLAIINGSFSLWGDGPLALVERSAKIAEFEEFLFDKDYKRICFENKNLSAEVYGACCRARRMGRESVTERWFTVDDAKTAGLLNKPGPWKDYRPRMLQMRARSWALKDAFPDVLLGVSIAEYDHNALVLPDGSVSETKPVDRAASLKQSISQVGE